MSRVDAKTNPLTTGLTQNLFKIPFTRDKSIKFDGTDDLVTTTANETLATQTFSFWLKKSDTSERQTIFTHGLHYRGAFHISWDVSEDHGPIIYFDSGSYKIFSDAACPQQDDGNWHHWLVAVDSAAVENSRLWIDGEEITSVVATNSGAGGAFTKGLRFGKSADQAWHYGGSIDEFGIFTGLQTDKDFIRRIYNDGQPTNLSTEDNLAHYFRMGEGKLGTKSDGESNLLFDQGPNGGLGSEKVTNGNFSADSGWTKGTGWTISGGVASIDGSQSGGVFLYQSAGLVTDKVYKVTFDVVTRSAGQVRVNVGGNTTGTYRSATGTFTEYLKSDDTAVFYVQADSSFNGSIDNVSVREVQNVGTINGPVIKDESTAESVPKKTQNLPSAGSAKSMAFDGSDDFATLPYQLPATNFTISQWINVREDSTTSDSAYVWDSRDASNTNANIFLPIKSALTAYKLRWWNAGDYRIADSTEYPVGVWQHVVLVKEGTTGTIYVDGEKLASATTFSSPTNGAAITVGRRYAASFQYAEVDFDEVAIWDTALDGDAIRALYNAGLPTPVTTKTGAYDIYRDNLKAYYKMGDATNPAADGTSSRVDSHLFDQTNPGLGAELSVADPYTTGRWGGLGTNTPTFVAGESVRIDRPASGGDSAGGYVYLTDDSGGFLTEDLVATKVYKLTLLFETDDSNALVQVTGGGGHHQSSAGSGVKTFYMFGLSGAPYMTFAGLDNSKFLKVSQLSVKPVNGNTGTITGATIQTEAPKAIYALPPVANTKSLNFDGTNDHLITQVDSAAQPNNESRYYSWWYKSPSPADSKETVFSHGAENRGMFAFDWSGGRNLLYMASSVLRYWNSNSKSSDNAWHHWVLKIKYNDITGCELWCDGEKQTVNATTNSGSMNTYTSGITIGAGLDNSRYLGGSLDEFSIHEELDEEAIRALYNRGRPIDISSGNGAYDQSDELLHYWRMGDATNDGTNDIVFQGLEFESDEMFPTNPSWHDLEGLEWDGTKLSLLPDASSQSYAQYSVTLPVGQTYRLTLDIENDGTGNFYGRIGDGNNALTRTNVTTGTYEVVHTVTESGANNYLFFIVNGGFSGTISNISLNRIRGQYIGPELLTNGDFSDNSVPDTWNGSAAVNLAGWAAYGPGHTANAHVTITNGAARLQSDGTYAAISQTVLSSGASYKYSIDVTDATSGSIQLYGGAVLLATINSAGTYSGYWTSTDSNPFYIKRSSTPIDITFDNVSVKEVGGAAVMTNMTTSDLQLDTPY